MGFFTINPATGEKLGGYRFHDWDFVLDNLRQGHNSFEIWKSVPLSDRIDLMQKLAEVFDENNEQYATLISKEMGKVIRESRAEISKCSFLIRTYCQNVKKWLQDEVVRVDGRKHYVHYDPLGAILSIMPWNFPFWQVVRFAVPAIFSGNVSILKHSNQVPETALSIEKAFLKAGFPKGVFQTVLCSHEVVEKMIESRIVNGVSFTGSTSAGIQIASLAGKNLKKVVLELGGSDPFIVFKNCDLDKAVENAYLGRFQNAGQSCIAAKRFIVEESIKGEFTDKFVELVRSKKVGNPLDVETDIGPLVGDSALKEVKKQVEDAVRLGAKIEIGGEPMEGKGHFFAPTVLSNVTQNMKVLSEEVFGPVAPIIGFRTEEEAIKLANRTPFGLGASIWSNDLKRAKAVAVHLECGVVFVNSMVKSDPRMPFGGIKMSGIGRELSHFGLKEFVNIKSFNIYD